MPAELRQRFNELYLDYLAGRLDAYLSRFDDDVDFIISTPPDVFARVGQKKGKAALAAVLLKARAEYEYLSYRPHVVGGDAEAAAVIVLARVKQRATGQIGDFVIAKFVRFRGDRIVELRQFADRAGGVENLFAGKSLLAK